MNRQTCCFTGHREISSAEYYFVKKRVMELIDILYEQGVRNFISGGALGFDTIAIKSVLEYKKHHNDIKAILLCPCRNQDMKWKKEDRIQYEIIKKAVDEIVILSEKYYRGCMHVRNRMMVDNSDYCICYLRKNTGGTFYTVNYAIKNEMKIFYI